MVYFYSFFCFLQIFVIIFSACEKGIDAEVKDLHNVSRLYCSFCSFEPYGNIPANSRHPKLRKGFT